MKKISLLAIIFFFLSALQVSAQVHNRPETFASLSPSPSSIGGVLAFYSDPVTVNLTATADTGFNISNTYYKIDGGSQQVYTIPFNVSGIGKHSIEYWSVDNTGIEENIKKSKSFTISYQRGSITNIIQNGNNIEVQVNFENFSEYTSQNYNNDCYTDSTAAFELYNADTGNVVSSYIGGTHCGNLGGGDAWLAFPPIQLESGNYFIHYSGLSYDWVTSDYSYTEGVSGHGAPTTNLTLSPNPTHVGNGLAFYSDPVTIVLTATADTGYNVAHTYYKVDGGDQEEYIAPFIVSGTGKHSIEYWSVDNTAIEESPKKSKSFTIGYQIGTITSITQNGNNIDVNVNFENFSEYTSQNYNNTCYTDSTAAFQLYDTDTGNIVSSYAGGAHCGSTEGGDAWLAFPPIQLESGNYFIHYSGLSYDWVTSNYNYVAPVPEHDNPITNINLSPNPTSPGGGLVFYSDPVTVTLIPSADTGYNITHTYYKIDGGNQQEYTAPFTVSGLGKHSVEYWSIDNTEIEESPKKSKAITINYQDANIISIKQNPISIDMTVNFENFSDYTSQNYNNDCYTDSTAAFELYNADTGNVVSSYIGGTHCGNLGGGDAWLAFPSLLLPPGTYWLHYSGLNYDWISASFEYAPTPTTTITLESIVEDDIYANPTTVTLYASAAVGTLLANTYYVVDGGTQQVYNSPFTISGNGLHTVEYWSVDDSGAQEIHNVETFTIFENQSPIINPIFDSQINQGATYSATGSFTDPDSTSWSATVDYGDGVGPESLTLNPGKTFDLSHHYSTAGVYTVTVEVTDDGLESSSANATIIVNAIPQILGLSDAEINYQDEYFATGSFTDPDSTSWSATVDYGDGFGEEALILNSDKTFMLDNLFPAVGVYNIIVKITDNQDATGQEVIVVRVNTPPHINQLTGATINEGGEYSESGSFADIDSSSWTASVNYGDGSGIQSLILNTNKTFSLDHLYIDNGEYKVTVSITDNQGAIGFETTTVIVNNLAPSVGAIIASVNPIQINTSLTATTGFADSGVLDTHTAIWDWGDGSTSPATVVESNGSGNISNNHIYTQAGVYEIILTVIDKDGGIGTQTFQYLSVYSPTPQGLFSAGQKYISPAGALFENSSAAGNVKFGLSYKYQGDVPSGNRHFTMDFSNANFEFNATSISSLVISNGVGTLRGTGNITNRSGEYNFLVVGKEGADTIRIKISNPSNNVIIYDTQPGASDTATPATAVTAGNILAH